MTRTLYGHKQDGTAVHAYSLGAPGGLTATVLDMGGTITAIRVPAGGVPRGDGPRNVVRGLADLAAYEASGWWNCLIGRYANRIRAGFTLDGVHYPLLPDANGVTLHGGRGHSWGTRLWEVVEAADDRLRLRLVSPDGDQGFPGRVTVDVAYAVADGALRLDYAATTDAATPLNLTNHVYFNPAGGGTVLAQLLTLNADRFTPTDALQIPTGELAAVAGTAFDFRVPAAIGTRADADEPQMRLARGLDHNFVLNRTGDGVALAARLEDPASGRAVEVWTTEPGIQVYSTNNVTDQRDAAGRTIPPRGGLALETQHFPDSPNQPDFPGTILRPGGIFRSTTLFRLT